MNFPVLYSDRLKLRKLDPQDFSSLIQLAGDRSVSDHIVNIPYPFREPDAAFRLAYIVKGFKEKSRFIFALEKSKDGKFIGECSLHLLNSIKAEVGYWIGRPFRNLGYASEAIKSICDFGFTELGLTIITASTHHSNIASRCLLEKCNFTEYKSSALSFIYYIEKSKIIT